MYIEKIEAQNVNEVTVNTWLVKWQHQAGFRPDAQVDTGSVLDCGMVLRSGSCVLHSVLK